MDSMPASCCQATPRGGRCKGKKPDRSETARSSGHEVHEQQRQVDCQYGIDVAHSEPHRIVVSSDNPIA